MARRTRHQLMEERYKLQQECMEWQSRLMDVKQLVLDGLGKNSHLYSLEVIDDGEEPWEANVVVKKKSDLNDIRISQPQVSILSPMNGIIEHCFNQMIMNSKGLGLPIVEDKTAIQEDHDDEKEALIPKPEIMIKEEILETESPSHI